MNVPIKHALLLATVTLLFSSCVLANENSQTIRVGVSGGPMEQLVEEAVIPAAKQEGLNVHAVVFSGFINPNQALDEGDIQANAFQHIPYLNGQIKTHGYHLVPVAYTISAPLGIYSAHYTSLKDLPDGASIGVPTDDTSLNRALLILQHYGLIKLRDGLSVKKGDNASPRDIVSNPRHLQIKEVDTVILARSLQDFDAAAIVTANAVQAGLNPEKDAIAKEPVNSEYRNVLVVRSQDTHAPWVAKLVQAFHSQQVRDVLRKDFNGVLVPAF